MSTSKSNVNLKFKIVGISSVYQLVFGTPCDNAALRRIIILLSPQLKFLEEFHKAKHKLFWAKKKSSVKAFNLNHITIHEQHWDEWHTAISCTQRQHFPLHSGAIYPTDRAGPTVSLETVKGTMLYTMGPFTQQTGLGQRSRLVSNSARAGAFTTAISARL